MDLTEKLKNLHNLGLIAAGIFDRTETEPRTSFRILPNGEMSITFYSSCFSFIPRNTNQLTFPASDIDLYLQKAQEEVKLYKEVGKRPEINVLCFKPKPDVIPIIIFTEQMRRIYYVHLCKDHRKDHIGYKPKCKCYITYEEFDENGDKI